VDAKVCHAAFDAGVTDFLVKPYDHYECRARCRNLLTMREQQLVLTDRAKLLEFENINYVIIDINDEVVKEGNEAGFPIFKGDISQLDTLNSLGASRASIAILTINNDIKCKMQSKNIISEDNIILLIIFSGIFII
jgi:response regulator RpfG family c-di-GMP phosphodiesterase